MLCCSDAAPAIFKRCSSVSEQAAYFEFDNSRSTTITMKVARRGLTKLALLLPWLIVSLLAIGLLQPASAEIVLSEVIVDLSPSAPPREDVEVWNNGSERAYVAVEPAEIRSPGMPDEIRF